EVRPTRNRHRRIAMLRVCSSARTLALAALTACQLHHASQPAPRQESTGSEATAQSLSTDQPLPKVSRIEQLLEGRVAGVEVIRTRSGGLLVRIRGGSTLAGSPLPLYVINGLPVYV